MDQKRENYEIKSVQRAIQLLRAFSRENRRLTLTEIHEKTKLSKPSLQRLLYTLTEEGLLEKNEIDKRYGLGLDFIYFAELVKRDSSLLYTAEPIMQKVHEATSESVGLSIVEKQKRKCIATIESKYELSTLTYIGQYSPLYAGASAKVLLAHFSDEALQAYLHDVKLTTITENTTIDKKELMDELGMIKQEGYAMSDGERVKGAVSISAPIFDPFQKIIASISVTIPSVRIEEYEITKIIELICKSAREVTNKLRNDG